MAQTPSPAFSANRPLSHHSPSPGPTLRSTSKEFDRDHHYQQHDHLSHQRNHSNSDRYPHNHNQQQQQQQQQRYTLSPSFDQRPPNTTTTVQPFTEPHSYYNASSQEKTSWRQQQPDSQEWYPPPTRSSSSAPQSSHRRLSYTSSGSIQQPFHPSEIAQQQHQHQQRPYSAASYHDMPSSPTRVTSAHHYSPESNQAKRHRVDSDSEGFSETESRYRYHQLHQHNQQHQQHPQVVNNIDPNSRPYSDQQEHYHPTASYHHIDHNSGRSRHHSFAEPTRESHSNEMFHSVAPSVTADGQAQQQLQHIAPRPPRYPNDEDLGPNSSQPQQQEQQEQQQSTSHFIEVKSETGSEPFKIQSARGTPKGPLPIDVQLKLLTSVLKHDPFNCAIRKTTQAWESISREQGIRARTCSRRFDNIIQASIARRDRPVGTPEQQAEKKQLLEKLLEMMNRPQALKRMQKKRRYRSEETDRRLLQETIRLNPFAQKVGQVAKAWEDVRDALKMKVHARQCIRRVNRMVKPYQLRERMYKGNIPDEMKETNDDLVKQVIQLMNSSGLNQSLDDHSNDEDGVSDSEDQEDPFMDGKDRDNAQEDDELEDDEDDDMVSASESENNPASKIDGVQQQSVAVTGSPPALVVSPTSTQPTTSSSTSTQPTTSSSASTTSGPSTSSVVPTPAKRGRPRNNQNTAPQITEKTRKRLSTGSDTKMEIEMVDSKSLQQQQQPLSHDGPSLDTDLAAASASVEPRYPGQRALSHTATLSPPHPVYSPPGPHSQGPVNDHLYPPPPQASYQHMDYRRPLKHVRSDSRGEYDTVSHPTREMEESNYRHGAYAGRGQQSIGPQNHPDQSREPVMDGYPRHVGGGYHASAASAGVPGNNFDEGHEGIPPPSSQNLREVLGELRYIQDRLAQMEEQKRDDSKKQASMRYLIDKLQHQVQVQQKQLYDLQNQLRYGYPTSPSQQKQQNQGALGGGPVSPPPHHYHEQRHSSPLQGSLGTTPSSSSGGAPPLPPSSTARYSEHHNNAAPYQMNVPGRSSMEHPHQDIPHHSSSYSRSDVQYHRDR